MKRIRKGSAILVLALLLTLALSVGAASAQSAYQTSFTTSITYQNVGAAAANVSLNFYDENSGTAINIAQDPLPASAGTSLFVGNVNQIDPSFRGSAVLSSDQPIVATLVQVPIGSPVKNRPLSNGFSGDEGATSYLIATALKNQFASTTIFSVQNVDSGPVNLTINLVPVSGTTVTLTHNNLPPGAAKYYDLGQLPELASMTSFNGSATISATGNVVASALELSTNSTGASSFEGVSGGASTVYMPSALCNAFGGQNSAYAIQNTSSTATASVTVTFSNGLTTNATIAPNAKASIQGCSVNPAGFSGSATITSTGADIVAIGKVFGAGLSTAFLGATAGDDVLALPYVRWSQTQYDNGNRQRTFIAIQNVGGADIPAGSVTVEYRDRLGALVGTHTLGAVAAGAKVNSNPFNVGAAAAEFGYDGALFGGGAVIRGPAGSQLVAVVRVQSRVPASNSTVAEDYNGIPIQ